MKSARELLLERARLDEEISALQKSPMPREAIDRIWLRTEVGYLRGQQYDVDTAIKHLLRNPHLQSEDDRLFLRKFS